MFLEDQGSFIKNRKVTLQYGSAELLEFFFFFVYIEVNVLLKSCW